MNTLADIDFNSKPTTIDFADGFSEPPENATALQERNLFLLGNGTADSIAQVEMEGDYLEGIAKSSYVDNIDVVKNLSGDLEQDQQYLVEQATKIRDAYGFPKHLYPEQAYNVRNPEASATYVRYLTNYHVARQELQEEIQGLRNNQNWLETALDFGDRIARDLTVGTVEGLTFANDAKAKEIRGKMASLSPPEFQVYLKGEIARAKEEGFFSSESPASLEKLLGMVIEPGVADGIPDFLLSAFDVATLGVGGAAIRGIKAVGRKVTKEEVKRATVNTDGIVSRVAAAESPDEAAKASNRMHAAGVVDEKVLNESLPTAIDPVSALKNSPKVSAADETPSTTGFETEKGSTYALHGNTTIRNKAKRADPGHENDFGLKPQSARTIYVEDDPSRLSAAGLNPKPNARLVIDDTTQKAHLLIWNEKESRWGISPSSRAVSFSNTPKVGSYPVEVWDSRKIEGTEHFGFANQHAGSRISKLIPAHPAAKPAAQAAPTPNPVLPVSFNAVQSLLGATPKANAAIVSTQMASNSYLSVISHMTSTNALPYLLTTDEAAKLAVKMHDDIVDNIGNPIANFTVREGTFGDKAIVLRYGKASDGSALTAQQADGRVEEFAERGYAAEAVPVNPLDHSKGWFVEVIEPLVPERGTSKIDVTSPYKLAAGVAEESAKIIGSTRQLDSIEQQVLANLAAGADGAFKKAAKPYFDKISRVNAESQAVINQVMTDLRDNPALNWQQRWWNENEFRVKFQAAHPRNKYPTDKEVDAYMAAVTSHDAAYAIRASVLLRRLHTGGYKGLYGLQGNVLKAKVATEVAPDAAVFDIASGKTVRASNYQGTIWESLEEANGTKYFSSPRHVGNLNPWDVLDYNSGGPRWNQRGKFFLVSVGKDDLGSKAIMTAFSRKSAQKAKDELNTIRAALAGRAPNAVGTSIDDIIRANNSWNKEITNALELDAWTQKHGWDWSKEIDLKPRGGLLDTTENIFKGLSYDDYYAFNMKRGAVLPDYGGWNTFNSPPLTNITSNFLSATQELTFRRTSHRAKIQWLKQALGEDGFRAARKDESVASLFDREFSALKENPKARLNGPRLVDIGNIIRRRDEISSDVEKFLDNAGDRLNEYIFDTTGKKTTFFGSPISGFMNLAFKTSLGLFNMSQVIMQSTHMMAIQAISPIHGVRAAAGAIPLRILLHGKNATLRKRWGQMMGLSTQETDELFTYIHTSGRTMVENDHIYRGTSGAVGIGNTSTQYNYRFLREGMRKAKKVVYAIDEKGMIPFNTGEVLTRLTAITTAYLENKAKNRGFSALTQEGRTAMVLREGDLTSNMTRQSRAAFQAGSFKPTTQFFSYHTRAFEQVFLGREFTKGERLRLLAFHAMVGGIAGAGFVTAADELAERFGLEPGDPMFAAIHYGFVDGILKLITNEFSPVEIDTAMGKSFSVISAYVDLGRTITGKQESIAEFVSGASGSILSTPLAAALTLMTSLTTGDNVTVSQALETLLRTPSSVDKLVKAQQILANGKYVTKYGTEVPFEMKAHEAWTQFFGINNFSTVYASDIRAASFRSKQERDSFVREQKKLVVAWRQALEDNRIGEADEIGKQIVANVQAADFPPSDISQIAKDLLKDPEVAFGNILWRSVVQGRDNAAKYFKDRM